MLKSVLIVLVLVVSHFSFAQERCMKPVVVTDVKEYHVKMDNREIEVNAGDYIAVNAYFENDVPAEKGKLEYDKDEVVLLNCLDSKKTGGEGEFYYTTTCYFKAVGSSVGVNNTNITIKKSIRGEDPVLIKVKVKIQKTEEQRSRDTRC